MEQMEIKSKETPIPNQNEFNDKDILSDVLSSLKSLSNIYGTLLQEVSNDDLYQRIEEVSNKVCTMQRNTFYKLFSLGWYVLEKSTQSKINKTISKYSKATEEID